MVCGAWVVSVSWGFGVEHHIGGLLGMVSFIRYKVLLVMLSGGITIGRFNPFCVILFGTQKSPEAHSADFNLTIYLVKVCECQEYIDIICCFSTSMSMKPVVVKRKL